MSDVNEKFSDVLINLLQNNKNLVVLNSDAHKYFEITDVFRKFENRFFEFGLGTQNMISAAVGFNARGKTPLLIGSSGKLIARGWEQIRNDIAYPNLNIKLLGVNYGLNPGIEGVSAQLLEDVAIMRPIANMKIFSPCDAPESIRLMDFMVKDYGPSYMRIHSGVWGLNLGVFSDPVLRNGTDICLFTTGLMVSVCLEVANMLEEEGFSVMVVNISCIKPLDEKLIFELNSKVKISIAVEEHVSIGGLSDAVMTEFRITVGDSFSQSGQKKDLYKLFGLDSEGVYLSVKGFLESINMV